MPTPNIKFAFITLILLAQTVFAQPKSNPQPGKVDKKNEIVKLATLELPPYTGEVPELGFLSKIIAKVFAKVNYKPVVQIYPWERAIDIYKDSTDGVVAIFPVGTEECDPKVGILSEEIGYYQYGFAQQKSKPVKWDKVADLTGKTVGAVRGYDNGSVINKMIADKDALGISIDYAASDLQNLQKLAGGRFDLASVNPIILEYYLGLGKIPNSLEMNSKITNQKIPMFICFNKSERAKEVMRYFNEHIKDLNYDLEVKDYMGRYFHGIGAGKAAPSR